MTDTRWLTIEEAAALLRVSRWTLYEWAKGADAVPAYRAGKRLLFDREELLAWFKETRRLQSDVPLPVRRRLRAVRGVRA